MPDQLLFIGQPQPARRSSGGDDHRAGFLPCAVDVDAERALRKFGFVNRAPHVLRAEALGLLLHVLDQFGAEDAFGETREIFDFGGEESWPPGSCPTTTSGFSPARAV